MVQLSAALGAGLEVHRQHEWVMLSVTFRHRSGMRLRWLRNKLMAAWRRARQHGSVQRIFKSRVVGTARAFEVTHGRHGWHPHLHVALLTTEWTEHERAVLADAFLRAFAAEACEKLRSDDGKVIAWDVSTYRHWLAYFTEYRGHAIKWSEKRLRRGDADTKLQAYLTDIGLELSLGPTKQTREDGSRTPWQIAQDAVDGDERSRSLWLEYESAVKGTRCIELDDRAAGFAAMVAEADEETVGEVHGEVSGELSFENAPIVGEPCVYVEIAPEMLKLVRDYERINPLSTYLWLKAAADTRGPLTVDAVRASLDACFSEMARALEQRLQNYWPPSRNDSCIIPNVFALGP